MGILIHHFGWNVTYMFLLGVVVVAIILMIIVGKRERALMK